MDIYKRRSNLKLVLLAIAVAIGLLTTLYTNYLTNKIAHEEKRKAKLWAEAITSKAHLVRYTNDLFERLALDERKKVDIWSQSTKLIAKPDLEDGELLTFLSQILTGNTDISVILATGNGAFYDALKATYPDKRISYYGTDIDPEVLKSESYKDQSNCKVEIKDFILESHCEKYHSIVANPPYVRHHRITKELKQKFAEMGDEILGFRLDGRAGLHIFFLLKALQLLEKNGKLAFIMPADTCEGIFANKLWEWILKRFRLEALITFTPEATPFPNVDTNAVVLLIKNIEPQKEFLWVRSTEAYSEDLKSFVKTGLKIQDYKTLQIVNRELEEGIKTGISREQSNTIFKYTLKDFAIILRGIATGANEFFTLTKSQIDELGISDKYVKRVVGRTGDVNGSLVTHEDLTKLDKSGRPTFLISLESEKLEDLPKSLKSYIAFGEQQDYHKRALIKTRNPWYKMEI